MRFSKISVPLLSYFRSRNISAHLIIFLLLSACSDKEPRLFELLSPEDTGITFINEILEDEYFNIISYEYLYNGAGVGIGDFNNDGYQDIFFCGNMTSNRLYLNKGNLIFEDITRTAGIEASDRWSTGIAVADLNNDGWQDIYVCASYSPDAELRKNLLFVNNGPDQDGIPTFTEKASAWGIDDDGYSTNAAFFDADNDGDLDLYVLTNILDDDFPNKYRPRTTDGTSVTNDRFYRNNGDHTFTNATLEAGIRYEGYGLGISIVDINKDGWKDIYITNDYLTTDLLYINNQDGTFTDRIADFTKHIGHSAMGHDIADINNDGLPDIYTLDMLPEDNQRLKQMYAGSRFDIHSNNERFGYHNQYKRNVLQLNNGADAYGNHLFSEIGLLSNTYATDWSWSALLADFDNDGYRDLFISNGYPRDVTDLDYATSGSRRGMRLSMEEELENIPVRHTHNYLYKNSGAYTFQDKSLQWGFDRPSYSNGAAYVDLDNDGDLDIVTNNINEPASIYENRLYSGEGIHKENHYLRIKIDSKNYSGTGMGYIVYAYVHGDILYTDHSTYHGFLSTVEPVVHFGLGSNTSVDSIHLCSMDGKMIKMRNVPADQTITIHQDQFTGSNQEHNASISDTSDYLFKPLPTQMGLRHYHNEDPFNDFNIQPAIPFQQSQFGPALAVADVDANGEYDLFTGGSKDHQGRIFLQMNGSFMPIELEDPAALSSEDQGALFFDIEGDGDTDLLVISGGTEQSIDSDLYNDRIYLNDGQGNFMRSAKGLPVTTQPGTCVKGADIDKDGDIDLFVGGGSIPSRYPFAASCYILRNDSKPGNPQFTDITNSFCPDLNEHRIIRDALWTDFNNDSNIDLIIAGEWTPLIFLRNTGEQLVDITSQSGIGNHIGWWNSLAGGDFDNDGDIDYIAGNHGLNSFYKCSMEEPITAYASDFDNDGRSDIIMYAYLPDINGGRKCFPIHFRNDLNKQIDLMRKRFPSFKAYSEATIDSVFSPEELVNTRKLTVNYFSSSYIENLGNNSFKITELPVKVQFAPVYGILTGDFNDDSFLDVLVVGNFHGNNPFWGKMDAMNGLLLTGNGKGEFNSLDYTQTGFLVQGDAKAIVEIPRTSGEHAIVVSQNQDSLKAFVRKGKSSILQLDQNDTWGEFTFRDGTKRKLEFYLGNTYYSQSAHVLRIPENVADYEIH